MAGGDALFDAGLECLAGGRWEEAVVCLREALVCEPGHVDAAHGLIRALDQAGRGAEALGVARELIARAPEDVLARTSLSMIYQKMGRIEEAEKAGVEAKLLGWKAELRQGSAVRDQGLRRIFMASSNAGKMRDFAAASGGRVRLEELPGLAGITAPAEDQETFEGNARVKAVYYSGFAAGDLVVADDSGLEVEALGGSPGVRSARYAEDREFRGVAGDSLDDRNNACLLDEMAGVAEERRGGQYRCCLAVARDGVVLWVAEGSVEGRVLTEGRGTGGFGYDPLFLVVERGRTMAEMGMEERLESSHRGRALVALLHWMDEADLSHPWTA